MEVPHHWRPAAVALRVRGEARRFSAVSSPLGCGAHLLAWLGLLRRLSKDYERLPQTGEAMTYGVMSRIMLRRLARAA